MFDLKSSVGEVYAHPLGRDAINKTLLQLGRSRTWVDNPVVRNLRLGWLRPAAERVAPGFIDSLLQLLNYCLDTPTDATGPVTPRWWKEAVFYQVYPRSFQDTDGDGLGDLRGIINRLDYLASLGIDGLWLSPVFASPNQDNGYDISDYRAIMPQMGKLADMDELIAGCHARGMRIILDLVVNHTSDQHAWAQAAMADPEGPYGDYYFMREGSPERPPNNWRSYFSGPAWRWLEGSKRWVLRLFASGQFDLNWDNPAVRREVADVVRWWLDRGVDGFRLDVINYISKHQGLPDGNSFVGELIGYPGVERYFYGPHLHEYLAELRRDGFTRDDGSVAFMVGETPGIGIETGRLLTAEDRGELDLIFNFDHLENPGKIRWDDYAYDLNTLKAHYIEYQSRLSSLDWMSIFFDNHDNPRMISKINPDPAHRTQLGKAMATIQLMMRGTPFLYQGQEIAAVNQDFTDAAQLRDVESINLIAEHGLSGRAGLDLVMAGSRDHSRTPMRWDTSPNHGFSEAAPWIGFHEASVGFTVAEQLENPDSVLNYHRALIELRRANAALRLGDITFVDEGVADYFAWFREPVGDGDRFFIEVNLSDRELPRRNAELNASVVAGTGPDRSQPMRPYEALVCLVKG